MVAVITFVLTWPAHLPAAAQVDIIWKLMALHAQVRKPAVYTCTWSFGKR